jgi:hypothetical protein
MNDSDANPGVETPYERARLVIALGWVAKIAGLALVLFYFWAGVLLFAVSWGLDSSVHPPRPAPDPRDRRLKWALLGFGTVFLGGWIAQMFRPEAGGLNSVMVAGLIGVVICEFSRYARTDVEYLRARRGNVPETDEVVAPEPVAATDSAPPVAPIPSAPQKQAAPVVVQGELPL